jgi:hypothetical protein
MDTKKISLFLAWKLPPYYGDSNLTRFQRVVSTDFNELYKLNDLDLFLKQSNGIEEIFFQNILEDIHQENSENTRFQDLLKKIIKNEEFIDELFSRDNSILFKKLWEKLKLDLVSIREWKDDSKKFEEYCDQLIKFLLEDSFNDFRYTTQAKSDIGLDINDGLLLNTYKDQWIAKNLWWDIAKDKYWTQTIIIEMKNYSKQAAQSVLFITEKYLHKAHTGRFALLFTRKWLSLASWEKKQIDMFKWIDWKQSVCFIAFNDADYIAMIDLKLKWESVESYILGKYFELSSKA